MFWSLRLFLINLIPALCFRGVFHRMQYGDFVSLLAGVAADLLTVALFVVPVSSLQARFRNKGVAVFSTLLWWAYYALMTTYFACMHVLPTPAQVRYLADLHFLFASLHIGTAAAVAVAAFALAAGVLRLSLCFRPLPKFISAALLLLFGLSVLHSGWRQDGNPLVRQAFLLFCDDEELPRNMLKLEHDLSGVPLVPGLGDSRPNVLLVILEGIPGGYLRQNVDFVKSSADFVMPKLSKWADRGFRVPNFLTHRNQTINGLYSMFCADYPRLFDGTPAVQELLAQPVSRDYLPEVLARNGYNTAYLQAAELRFMDKDRFMKLVGFDEVLGEEWFDTASPAFFSRWGINDRDFFLQSLKKVRELTEKRNLSQGDHPWFLALLTVGTHHPYALPEDYEEGQDLSPKLRSVLFLDDAVDLFLKKLEREGVLRDTLVIVTADESHGMDADVLLAGNWGLCFALTPQGYGDVNSELFGLVDLPLSILDYAGLAASADGIAGRSIFRGYGDSEKRILSGSWGSRFFVVSDDEVLLRDFGSDVFARYPFAGSPFALSNNAVANGIDGGEDILRRATFADGRKPGGKNDMKTWRFLPGESTFRVAEYDGVEPIAEDSKLWLSGGQYIQLRKGERYTLELDATAPAENAATVTLDWMLSRLDEKSPTGTAPFVSDELLPLPDLPPGERLSLSCTVEVREDFMLDSARLAARKSGTKQGEAHIDVRTFALRQIPARGALSNGRLIHEAADVCVVLDEPGGESKNLRGASRRQPRS